MSASRPPARPARMLLVVSALLIAAPQVAAKIYWTEYTSMLVRSADLDGSNATTIETQAQGGYGICGDPTNQYVYYTSFNSKTIRRCGFDGGGITTIHTAGASLDGLDVDPAGGMLYFVEGTTLKRVPAGGGVATTLVSGLVAGSGVGLDLVNTPQRVYYTDLNGNTIGRCYLDGSNQETIVTGAGGPVCCRVNATTNQLYWCDFNNGKIRRSNLDGTGQVDLVTGLTSPDGLSLDVSGGKMYYDTGGTTIWRANLDGSGATSLITGGNGMSGIYVATAAPAGAHHLAFTVQPASGSANASLADVKVAFQDASNATVTTATANVTLTLASNPGGSTLSGTTTVAAVSGVATFSGLSLNKVGTGYTLQAASSGLSAVTSSAFNITPGAVNAANSTCTVSPATATADNSAAVTFTITAKDSGGNVIPGIAAGNVVVAASPAAGVTIAQPSSPTNGSGQTTASAVSTQAGSVTFTVTINGTLVTQTAGVVFTPGPVDAATSTITASPTTVAANGVASTTLTITAKDAYGNPIAGIAAGNVVVASSAPSGVTITQPAAATNASGQTTASAVSTRAGDLVFSVTINGVPVTSTATVTFTPGAVNAATSTFTVDLTTATADGASPVTFTVTAKDAYSNVIPGIPAANVVVTASPDTGVTITQPTTATNSSGQTTAAAVSTKAATVKFAVTINGVSLNQSPAVTFTPGPPDAATSQLSANKATANANGADLVTFTITANDAQGNPIPNLAPASVSLAASPATGVGLTQPTTLTNASGQTTATAVSTKAGAVTFTVTLSGTVVTQTVVVTFNPGAVDAGRSLVAASPTTLTADGVASTTITVTARDANDNPIAGIAAANVVVAANPAAGVTIAQPSSATDASGQTTATATSTAAATVTCSVTVNGTGLVQTAAVTFQPGAPDAATCTFTGDKATATANAADTVTFTITARDAQGNAIAGIPAANVVVSAAPTTGVTIGQPASATNAGGQTTATAVSTKAGAVVFSVQIQGVDVTATKTVTFQAGPVSGAQSTLSADKATASATGADPVTFTFELRDAYGNPVAGVPHSNLLLAAAPSTGVTIVAPTLATDANGRSTATATSTKAATVTFNGTANGTALNNTVDVAFQPGPAAAGTTTATVPNGTSGSTTTISIVSRDANNNLRTTGGAAVAANVTGANTVAGTVTDNGDGTYTATYVPSAAGTDQVAITLGGAPISGSPFTSTVAAGTVSPAHTTATVPNGPAGQPLAIQVHTRDAAGNSVAVGGATVVIEVLGPNAVTPPVTDHGNGTYAASYVPAVAGSDQVAITYNGTPIAGSPYTAVIGVGNAVPGTSTATVPPGVAGQATTITVIAKDGYGNRQPAGGEAVAIAVSGANTATVSATDLGDGSYTAAYTPTVAGTDNVAVTLNGTAVASSPFTSPVSPGATSPAQCTATVPNVSAGQPLNVTVRVRDALGNARTSGGDAVVVTVTGANPGTPTVSDLANGTYTASYTAANAGTDQVAITVNGSAIGGSPYAATISVGGTSAARSTASVSAGVAGSVTTVLVQARDGSGNARTVGGDAAVVTVTGSNPGTPAVTDLGNGTYQATYTPTVTGSDTVAVTLNGAAVASSPFTSTVSPGATSPAQCTATVPNVAAGQPLNVTVRVRDALGNARTSGGDAVVVTVTGANPGTPTVSDLANGTYTASYTAANAGTDQVAITVNGTALGGSPFTAIVGVGPASAANSTANVPDGVAGSPTVVVVQARDAAGNARSTGGDVVVVTVTGANPATPAVTDLGDGTYQATYTPTVAGTDRVAITLGGVGIAGSRFTSLVSAAAPSAAQCRATVPAGTVGSATTLRVDAYDAHGNAVSVGGASFAVAISGANSATPTVTDLRNGSYTATYTPTAGGTDQVAITLDGTEIAGSPFTSLVAGAGSGGAGSVAGQSTATVGGGVAGQPTAVLVQARDATGQPRAVGGDAVTVTVIGANPGSLAVTDRGDGTYAASYTPLRTGPDQLSITLGGAAISGSPFTSLVVPGATSAAQTVASVPDGTAGSVTTVTVVAKDAAGNLRTTGGDVVTVAVTGANPGAAAVADQGNGTYLATYTPTVVGPDQITVTLGGAAVGNSPLTSQVSSGAGSPARSTATVPAGQSGQVTSLVVTVRDAQGNPRTAGGDAVAVSISGANTATPAVADHRDGTYTATYLPRVAGPDSVVVTLGGVALSGSPFTSVVAPGPVDAGVSRFTADRAVAAGDGSGQVTFTLTLCDAAGNPLAGVPPADVVVTADPAAGVTVTAPTSASNAAGEVTLGASATTPGAHEFVATVGGVRLTATVTVAFRPRFQVTLPAGKQFLGLPVTPDDATPEAVLGDPAGWVLGRWDAAAGAFARYRPGDDPTLYGFQPGRGLWLQPTAPLTIDVLAEPVPAGPFSLPVAAGWGTVANPFNADLPWDWGAIGVTVNGVTIGTLDDPRVWTTVAPYVWVYNPTMRRLQCVLPGIALDTVPRLAGFWARAFRDRVALVFGPPATARQAHPAEVSLRHWRLELVASQASQSATAVLGLDSRLTAALPIASPPGDETAVRVEVIDASGRAAGELRPADGGAQTWELAVTAPAGPVSLSWPSLLRTIPRGLTLELTDRTTGRTTLLNTRGGYRYTSTGGERRFALAARVGHLSRATITSLSTNPTRGGATTVALTLTGPAEVTLTVRGLGGRLVRSLTTTASAAGQHEVAWDGLDEAGRPLPAGSYVLEAVAVSSHGAVSRAVRTVALR